MRYFGQHKKILILLGHPDSATLCGAFAESYARGATAAGHAVKRANLENLSCDIVLHKGYKEIQTLEPQLKQLQEDIKWCDHLVVIYPNWWCTMPAKLKGVFDRMWLPGFAFRFRKDSVGNRKIGWDKLLKGRTGRIIITAGSNAFLIWLFFGDFTNELARGILGFAGIKTRITVFGSVENQPSWKYDAWFKRVERMGAHAR